jgi:molecular chaperone GrpE
MTFAQDDDSKELRPAGPVEEGEGSDAGAPQAGDELEQDIAALLSDTQRERDEYLELAQRTKADFENYRKRMAAEVQAASVRGKVELVAQLIGVIDNLERALAAAGVEPGSDKAPAEPLAEGFFLTYRELCAALGRAGIESFDPAGERFDPTRHEALQKVPVEGSEPGTVAETMQKGYLLGEQLIRPAKVVVSA